LLAALVDRAAALRQHPLVAAQGALRCPFPRRGVLPAAFFVGVEQPDARRGGRDEGVHRRGIV